MSKVTRLIVAVIITSVLCVPILSYGQDDSTVLATYLDKKLTREDLRKIVDVRKPDDYGFYTANEIMNLDQDEFADLIQQIVAQELLYNDLTSDPQFELTDSHKEYLERLKNSWYTRGLYQKEVLDKIKEITEEEARALYEETKQNYKVQYHFSIRHIFLSTYIPYTAKEGDTLEQIAETISKDKTAVALILKDDKTKEPRYVKPEEQDERPYPPLQDGEKLLVPMSKKEQEKVLDRIREIKKMLDEGADFIEVAKQYSETEKKGEVLGPIYPERGPKPVLQELLDAVKATPQGQSTDIVKSKHGYQIMFIEKKEEERIRDLEEVRARLERQIRKQKEIDVQVAFLRGLKDSPLLKIHREALEKEKPGEDEIVVEIKDKSFTFTSAMAGIRSPEDLEALKTADERIDYLLRAPSALRQEILVQTALETGIQNDKDIQFKIEQGKIAFLSEEHIKKVIDQRLKPTPKNLKDYFDKNIDIFIEVKRINLYMIMKKYPEGYEEKEIEEKREIAYALMTELNEYKKNNNIETKEAFMKAAREISEDEESASKGGYVGEVDSSFKGLAHILNRLEENQVSRAVNSNEGVFLVFADKITPIPPVFMEIQEKVKNAYTIYMKEKIRKQIIEDTLEKANFKLVESAPVAS